MSTRITDLPSASTVSSADVIPIVQGGVTKKAATQLVVVSQLPAGTALQAGIVQLGTTSGTVCDGADARLSNSRTPTGAAGGDLSGTYPNPELAALGTAGTYGSTSAIPVLTLDSKGRVASIATSQIIVNADNITSGTLAAGRLPEITGDVLISQGTSVAALQTTGVSAGTFGSSAQIPVLTVDAKGRITVAGSTPVLPGNNASDLTVGTLNPNLLATSGVAAGTFGSSVSVAQFTVDDKGRITNATNVGISGSAGGTVVAVGATSSTLAISNSPVTYSGALQLELSTTGVPAITAGSSTQSAVLTVDTYGRVTALETVAIAALSPTGVVSGSYGHPERVAQFTVDANGVITGATEAAIAIPAAAVSGLAASATSDTTNAGNIITGTLSSARIPVLASSQISGISAAQVGAGIVTAQISGLSASAVIDATNASNISSGTLNINRLATSGVAAGSFGSSGQIAAITVDEFGRITAVSNTPVSINVTNFGFVKENLTATATAATGTINYDVLTQAVVYYTLSATANWSLNIRGNATTTLNSSMNIGQSITIVFLNTNGASAFGLTSSGAFTIDGSNGNRTLRWANAVIPPPNSNSVDAWSFVVMKTADNSFNVFGSLSTFA